VAVTTPDEVAAARRARRGARRRARGRRFDVAFYVPWATSLLAGGDGAAAGGAETQVSLLARALARRGVRVCVVVFAEPGVRLPPAVDGVAVRTRPPYRRHGRLGTLRETAHIVRAIVGVDAGTVVGRVAGPEIGVVALAAKLCGRRFVYSSASVWDFDLDRVSPKRRNRQLFRLGLRMADEVVVQTDEQVELCRRRFNRTPALIASIAEPATRRTCAPEAFLWIGRLLPYKRPSAYVELARSLPEATFWMVAVPPARRQKGGDPWAELPAEARSLPNLEILPPRPRAELMELVDRAVAVVNTSDHEGMPNTFLEGWARGVPALSLAYDPDGVIVRRGLGTCAGGSPAGLTAAARHLWETRLAQGEIADRCRAFVAERHAPDPVAERWQEELGLAGPEPRARIA